MQFTFTQITSLQSLYHIRTWFAQYASKSYTSMLQVGIMWHVSWFSVVLTWAYGYWITVERNIMKKLRMQSWAICNFHHQQINVTAHTASVPLQLTLRPASNIHDVSICQVGGGWQVCYPVSYCDLLFFLISTDGDTKPAATMYHRSINKHILIFSFAYLLQCMFHARLRYVLYDFRTSLNMELFSIFSVNL